MRARIAAALFLAACWLLPPATVAADCVILSHDFQAIADAIPEVVGPCTGNETPILRPDGTPDGGTYQTTTNGMFVWVPGYAATWASSGGQEEYVLATWDQRELYGQNFAYIARAQVATEMYAGLLHVWIPVIPDAPYY